jgi:histidyl-tRNA synthetase
LLGSVFGSIFAAGHEMKETLSGFPEWLPEQELVQQRIIAIVKEQFELHGFTPIHTRSIEPIDELVDQGETDKEIYGIHRLMQGETAKEPKLGLHYDLTVPFARYVRERRGDLRFPFRRYQVQPAWRGERPQLGRYREFIQADADVITDGPLDVRFDLEMVRLLRETLDRLPVPRVKLLVNNRKVLEGFYRGLGIETIAETLRAVDKLAKIGADGVKDLLVAGGLSSDQADKCVALAGIELREGADASRVRALGVAHPLLDEGLGELARVLDDVAAVATHPGSVVGALHVARGLDYYTGTVVEGVLEEHSGLGAVCSGGRYDNLASEGGRALPGIGVSIGITRLLAYCFHLGLLKQPRRTPVHVMVAVHSEESRSASEAVARRLRARRIPTLVSDSSAAYGKQIKAASQLGIPYLLFPANGDKPDEMRDLRSGAQGPVELDSWVATDADIVIA